MKGRKVSGRSQKVIATGAAGLSAALGLTVLVGWYTHSAILVQVSPAFVPMQYNTALGFLLCGAGLLCLLFGRPHPGISCAAAATAIGFLTLIEYILGVDLGIDQLFMEHYITVETSNPGRMGPNTALCFTLTGAALLAWALAPRRLRSPLSGLLGSVTGALGLVALSGYLGGISSAYAWGQLTSMAVHTAVGFVVLGVGVVSAAWREGRIEGAPAWLAMSAGIGVATLDVALWQALDTQQRLAGVVSVVPYLQLATGFLMAFLVGLTVHLAQKAWLRAREVEQLNRDLEADITERKRAEQRLMAQHAVTQLLAEAATLDEVTPKILQIVCEFLLWNLGVLWTIDREAGVLRCVEVWHGKSVDAPQFEAASRESTFMPGIGLPGRIWSSHEPVCIPDVTQDANFLRASIAEHEGLHAAFGFPILLGGDVLGVMEFFSHEIRQPEQELLNMMANLGSQIGQFIERKRAEDALRHAQMELAHVTRVATLGEMSASIAHEINQPLAAVIANANASLRWLATATPNLDEARDAVSRIVRDGNRAGEVIARIRALVEKTVTAKVRLDINQAVQEVILLAQSEAGRKGVSLRMESATDVPPVLGDRVQLQQVVLNLVMNGVEAMASVADRRRELLIRSRQHGSDQVLVAVQDSGIGIARENLEKIFNAFYTTKSHGMGMGLAISRSIVENHGGRLWAIPNDGPGVTFQFTLPRYH
jgi:C4-dicarboxylate-specific signal transduction histidine kinase